MSPAVRVVRLGLIAAAAVLFPAAAASAQTTTTIPPIPVTGTGPSGATTTTAPRSTATTAPSGEGEVAAGQDLASTGFTADKLVPLAFGLIGAGAAMQASARRRRATGILYIG